MQVVKDFFLVDRNWGHFVQFATNQMCTVKLLHLDKGKSISYQYHKNRSEMWFLISGRCWFRQGEVSGELIPGRSITIEKLQRHKLEGLEDSLILEISKGYFDEDDIIRLD